MVELLDNSARDIALENLAEWQLAADGKAITKEFKFKNFSEAFAFHVPRRARGRKTGSPSRLVERL